MGIGLVAADDVDVLQQLFGDVGVQVEGSGDGLVAGQLTQMGNEGAAGVGVGLGAGGAVKGCVNGIKFVFLCVGLHSIHKELKHVVGHPAAGGRLQEGSGDGLGTVFGKGIHSAMYSALNFQQGIPYLLALCRGAGIEFGHTGHDGVEGVGLLAEGQYQNPFFHISPPGSWWLRYPRRSRRCWE